MTNQELATIVQESRRNVKVAVINNGYLGMVRQWQELFEDKRYSGTLLSVQTSRASRVVWRARTTVDHR